MRGTAVTRNGYPSPIPKTRNGETGISSFVDEIRFRSSLPVSGIRELDYRLTKSLWSFTDNRIAVRFQYEYHDAGGQWFRAYGNELWEFDAEGLMRRREASINDLPIGPLERKFHWPAPGPRPSDDAGISTVR